MVQFAIKTFVFIVLMLCLILCLTDVFFRGVSSYDEQREGDNAISEVDIAIFGSSHAKSSYDPRILELSLQRTSYNFGDFAQRLVTTKSVIDMLLESETPEIAIIDVFSVSLNENRNSIFLGQQSKSFERIPISLKKIKQAPKIFGFENSIWALSPTIRNHSKWNTFLSSKRNSLIGQKHLTLELYKGFRTNWSQFNESTWKRFKTKYEARNLKDIPVKALTIVQKSRIDDVISALQEKDILVLFVNAPSYITDFENNYRIESKLIKEYIEGKGLSLIDYNLLRDELKLKREHFTDPNHLNAEGAKIVSQHLAQFLRDSLKIEIGKEKVFKQNRYYHITTNYKHVLFNKKIDSVSQHSLMGLKEANMYNIGHHRYEIIFPLLSDSIGKQPLRFEYDVTPEKTNQFDKSQTSFNKELDKAYTWGTFKKENVEHFNGTYNVTFRFNCPLDTIRNVKFYGGDQRKTLVFEASEIVFE